MVVMNEYYLGIDVGFSPKRRTTGLCLITIKDPIIRWECRNTHTKDSLRLAALRELVPDGVTLLGVGIDGPIAKNLEIVEHYRSADSLLSRGCFQSRGKPGPTNSPTGQKLHQHATKLAEQVKGNFTIAAADHPNPVHQARIVEAFPTAFLAFLLSDKDFPVNPGRKKSDVFWDVAVGKGYLNGLIQRLAPSKTIYRCLDTITNHDHRAAFICALTALCVSKVQYVAAGDPEGGYIFLPPRQFWGSGDNSASWAEDTIRKNLASVRGNPTAKIKNHRQAQVICNGNLWQFPNSGPSRNGCDTAG